MSINTCPRKLFITNLEQFIAESIGSALKLILIIDTNDHVVKFKLAQEQQNLGLAKTYCNKFKTSFPTSCFKVRCKIDGVWFIRNTVITSVAMCTFNFGVGYHRACVVGFQVNIFLG